MVPLAQISQNTFSSSQKIMLDWDPLYFEMFNFVRFFIPRRNRYVLVANFGEEHVNLEPVGQIYSGGELVLDTNNTHNFIKQVSKICSPPELTCPTGSKLTCSSTKFIYIIVPLAQTSQNTFFLVPKNHARLGPPVL